VRQVDDSPHNRLGARIGQDVPDQFVVNLDFIDLATSLPIRVDNDADRQLLPPPRQAEFRSTRRGSQQAGLTVDWPDAQPRRVCDQRVPLNVAVNY
jgi:hypothetical protein